jgi:hypothetical protein
MDDTSEILAESTEEIAGTDEMRVPFVSSYEAVELSCWTSASGETAELCLTEKNGNAHCFTIPLGQLWKFYLGIDPLTLDPSRSQK